MKSEHLPILGQVPSKSPRTGKKMSNRRKNPISAKEPAASPLPIADSSWTLTTVNLVTPEKTESIRTTKTSSAEAAAADGKVKAALLPVRPVIVKSQRSSPCSAPLHRGNPPQRQNEPPGESWLQLCYFKIHLLKLFNLSSSLKSLHIPCFVTALFLAFSAPHKHGTQKLKKQNVAD